MKQVDYGEISKIYDDVREADVSLINQLLQRLPSKAGLSILDIGCGTGNYTDLLQKMTQEKGVQVCGLDPSEEMLAKARQKNARIEFRLGTAGQIPWDQASFDSEVAKITQQFNDAEAAESKAVPAHKTFIKNSADLFQRDAALVRDVDPEADRHITSGGEGIWAHDGVVYSAQVRQQAVVKYVPKK